MQGLGHRAGATLVVAASPRSDRALTRASDLATRIARAVAAAAGSTLPSPAGALTLGEARARASGANVLVYVSIEVSGGRLRVGADAYSAHQTFWDRVRSASPSLLAHALSERRIDGEVGSFLPAVPVVSNHVEKATAPTDVVAIACDDVDADGALDIVVVGRHRIEKGRIRAGRFEGVAAASWSALSPVAPSPLREPIASAVVAPGRYVDVGITDRRAAARLDPKLRELGTLDQLVPVVGVGCMGRAGLGLGAPKPCKVGERPVIPVDPGVELDAVSGANVIDAEGRLRTVVALRERSTRALVVKDDGGRVVRLLGVGGQVAVGDLDFDGSPEIVFGSDTPNPKSDVLTVDSWTKGGGLRERLRLPVPDGVKALAVCPAEDARAAPIVVATGGSFWVVR